MYCLGCDYNLAGVDQQQCPECGRGFDPADAATFAGRPSLDRPQQRVELMLMLVPLAIGVSVLALIAFTILSIYRFLYGLAPAAPG